MAAATDRPIPSRDATGSAATRDTASGTTAIRVRVGDTVLPATLWDNAATRSLVAQLPLTLAFEDFARQEKIGTPPRPPSMDGMPSGDDPEPLDIGYYAPDGVLVLHYADVGYFTGIARLAHVDQPIDAVVHVPDGAETTIEIAD